MTDHRGRTINLLDHGFVRLLDYMGDDLRPAAAARVSYGVEGRGWDKGDGNLTRYLLDNHHTSPFEQVEVVFEVKCPIFVSRQWVRHRTANINEFSMRYADPEVISSGETIDTYGPDVWRGKSATNKQGSSGEIDEPHKAQMMWHGAMVQAKESYGSLQLLGVANELARIVLPVSTYTQFWWKNDLHNTLHFFDLRADSHAQYEIQVYAEAMMALLAGPFPKLMELYNARRIIDATVEAIKTKARVDSGQALGGIGDYTMLVEQLVKNYAHLNGVVGA